MKVHQVGISKTLNPKQPKTPKPQNLLKNLLDPTSYENAFFSLGWVLEVVPLARKPRKRTLADPHICDTCIHSYRCSPRHNPKRQHPAGCIVHSAPLYSRISDHGGPTQQLPSCALGVATRPLEALYATRRLILDVLPLERSEISGHRSST